MLQDHKLLVECLFDYAPDAIIVVNEQGLILQMNIQAEVMFGCNRSELVSRSLKLLLPERFHEGHIVQPRFSPVGATFELYGLRRNGQEFPIEVSLRLLKTEAGLITINSIRDSSERKQAEKALQESAAKLQTLFEILPVGVTILDKDRNVIEMNPAVEKILDISKEALLRGNYKSRRYLRHDGSLMPSSEFPSVQAVNEQRVVVQVEIGVVKEDETTIWTEVRAAPLPIADLGAVVVTTDITERKQMEEHLKAQERWLAATLSSIAESILTCDANGAVTFMNPAAQQLTGWSQAEAVGKPVTEIIQFVSERSQQILANPLLEALSQGQPVRLLDKTLLITREGLRIPIDDMAAPITNERGQLLGAVLVFHDVIERRLMESQLLQMQKMEAVGQLAAGVAHNFNNILTAIIGYASMVIEALPPDHPAIADLTGIQGAVQRATKLTGELLTFSRRRPTQPVFLNLNKLIMELHNLLCHLLPKNIELDLWLQPDLGWTEVDPAQLEQVLVNLVLNARDAMPNGGRLNITTANLVLEAGTARPHPEFKPGNYLVLSVSDTGVGMTEAVKARIFEPFFTTKEVGRGTGLGLATCLGVIKQHNGYITVDSQPGQGAAFKIYLPQTEAEAQSI